ncbi:MAG: PAS domain S-box protein, partial [Desulfomonilia bacterium]
GESAATAKGFDTNRRDEIGTLTREFGAMVKRLAEREKRLDFGEKRLRQIIDLVPHYIYAKDTDGRFILVNKAVADVYGTPIKDLIGEKDSTFAVPGDETHGAQDKSVDVPSSGSSRPVIQGEITDSHGDKHFVQTTMIPFSFSDISTPAVLGVSVDITGIKRAEEALRESQRRLSDIIDFLPDATFAIDREGRVIAWNRAIEKMTGVTKLEILGKDRYAHAVPFYGEARPVLADLLFEGHEDVENKYDFISRDGDKLVTEAFVSNINNGRGAYLWATAAPLYDSNGNIAGAIECIRDITERKKAEELLQQHSKTIEQSLDGIIMADLDGKIRYVNHAWAMMHGYPAEELNGKQITIFHTEEQFKNYVMPFNIKALELGSHRDKLWHMKKDGTIFPTLMSAFMLKDSKDKPVAVVGIARDISEELRLENQLRQAQKMEVIGQLAGGVAHDLNNMLSPILGYAEIILSDMKDNDPQYDDVMQIKAAAERARNLTHELLAFSRKQVLDMKVVDLAEVVASYGKMLRRAIRENIAIQIRHNLSKGAVRVDIGQMGQVLMNLAINAQDAIQEGGIVSIDIKDVTLDDDYAQSHPGAVPGEYVAMIFSDTGSGMNTKTMEHIFEPFFTTKERGKGTGLGLATVYGIVRQHNGNIAVSSEPGKGATFTIYLPTVEGAPETLVSTAKVSIGKKGHETVVVAEDDDGVRELTFDILQKHGYRVITASNTGELFQALHDYDGSVDMLLTDVIMPGMNGRELFEKLKSSYPELKVIFMSGYTDDVIAHHGILEEGMHFIQKPFSINLLTDKVRSVLDG